MTCYCWLRGSVEDMEGGWLGMRPSKRRGLEEKESLQAVCGAMTSTGRSVRSKFSSGSSPIELDGAKLWRS